MPLHIQDILGFPSLQGAVVLAGHKGLFNEISGIMVMEAPDVEGWGSKGLVLLSSLYSIQHYGVQEQAEFMRRLYHLGISAMIVKIDRFVDKVPPGILAGGDDFGIPVVQIEKQVKYNSIMVEVMQSLFNQHVQVLEFYRTAHSRFTQLALRNFSGQDIVRNLSDLVKKPISICGEDGACLYTTNLELQQFQVRREEAFAEYSSMKFPYKRQVVIYPALGDQVYTQIVIEVRILSAPINRLIVHEMDRFVSELDIMAIENAAAFIQMDMLRQQSVAEARQKYLGEIFDDILSGRYASRDNLLEYAAAIGLREGARHRLVVWQYTRDDPAMAGEERNKSGGDRTGHQLALRVKRAFGGVVFRVVRNRIQFIFEAGEVVDSAFMANLRHFFTYLQEEFTDQKLLLRVAVGEAVGVEELKHSAEETQKILNQAVLFPDRDFFMRYGDLGIYALLAEIGEQPEKLEQLIPGKLQLLRREAPDLLETLQAYLDCSLKLKETAGKLYVHYKTVRYRIQRIQAITDMDFADAEELLQISIGLRICAMLER